MSQEHNLYKRLVDNFVTLKPKRMENSVSHGFGDLYVLLPLGRVTWIELKSVKRPKQYSSWLLPPSSIRNSQLNFHRKHAQSGVQTWFLIEDNNSEPVRKRMLYLVPGCVLLGSEGINYGRAATHCMYTSFHPIEANICRNPYITKLDARYWVDKFK